MTHSEAIENLKELLSWYLEEEEGSITVYKVEAVQMAIESLENYHRLKHIIGERLIDVDKCHMSPRDALEEIRKSIKSH